MLILISSKIPKVKVVVCPAQRSFITVAEISTPDPNVIHAPKCPIRCFLKRPYCTCETFSSKVVYKSEITMVNALFLCFTCTLLRCRGNAILSLIHFSFLILYVLQCEHLLAANLAERLKIIPQVQLTDEEFGEALYLLRTP